MIMKNKHILIGVTGGIAAYKSAELVRLFKKSGAMVKVVMTPASEKFVTALTFRTLTGEQVFSEVFDDQGDPMPHIDLARWADVILIAPATADCIARLTQGRSNDLLTAVCLATTSPVALAPAMNKQMWEHDATQKNIETLVSRGLKLFGPDIGDQACGEFGEGRMLEPSVLQAEIENIFKSNKLSDLNVVITAGPTQEHIDPVRYISNRSTGKMGYAIAQAAQEAGAHVKLISGPVNLAAPENIEIVYVESAVEMNRAVMENIEQCEIFISTAAVADYRPVNTHDKKIKKTETLKSIKLQKNPDILTAVANLENPPFTLGFAAETDNLESNAKEKLLSKNLNMIAANKIGEEGHGIASSTNAIELYWSGGHETLPLTDKGRLARQLVNILAKHYQLSKSNVIKMGHAKGSIKNP